MPYTFSHASEVRVPFAPATVFEILDDPLRLGRHMEKPSPMMLWGSMRYRLDEKGGRDVGSVICADGSVLGLQLSIVERITERVPPWRKVWETLEEPSLLVFGNYRLGFEIAPDDMGSRVRIFVDYDLPQTLLGRLFGPLGAPVYARWCVSRMIKEASAPTP
jgi:hypothetical protein